MLIFDLQYLFGRISRPGNQILDLIPICQQGTVLIAWPRVLDIKNYFHISAFFLSMLDHVKYYKQQMEISIIQIIFRRTLMYFLLYLVHRSSPSVEKGGNEQTLARITHTHIPSKVDHRLIAQKLFMAFYAYKQHYTTAISFNQMHPPPMLVCATTD